MSLDSMGPSTANTTAKISRMMHSLSTPIGVDGLSGQTGRKKLVVRIQMLDDNISLFFVTAKSLGHVLFEQVCKQLNLLEADYFGLEYDDGSSNYWLDLEKALNEQIGLSSVDPILRFCVKFYTPDPNQLEEEYTRYLFCLQIKRDLAIGSLQCSDNTAALMASYIVQASCGDYSFDDYPDHNYLSSHQFVPQQDIVMQRRIMECHKKHIGQSPAEADLNLLETARRCEFYGIKMHSARDHEGVSLNLAVAHMGISVFQSVTRISNFSWAKIRKISFKRKRFLIKMHSDGIGYLKETMEFFFSGRNECKNFWKKCVETHSFFRVTEVQKIPRRKTKVLSRGSSFRYSGKTQKEIIEFVRDNYIKRQNFQRSQSFRQGTIHSSIRSQSDSSSNVNTSISVHPLLPIDAVDWDLCSQRTSFQTLSLMKKEAETTCPQLTNPISYSQTQDTSALIEDYRTKKFAVEIQKQLQVPESSSIDSQTHHLHINSNLVEADQFLAHQGNHNTDSTDHLYVNLAQQCTHHNLKYPVSTTLRQTYRAESKDHNRSAVGKALSLENVFTPTAPTQVSSTLYNNRNIYSMCKPVSIESDNSEENVDKIIYTDIDDLKKKAEGKTNKCNIAEEFSLNMHNTFSNEIISNNNDLYATIDRGSKSTKARKLNEVLYVNVRNTNIDITNETNALYKNCNNSNVDVKNDCLQNTFIDNIPKPFIHTYNFSIGVKHFDCESSSNLNNDTTNANTCNINNDRILRKATTKFEFELSNANIYSTIHPPRTNYDKYSNSDSWQRSSSCTNLHHEFLTFDRVDLPITRFNDYYGSINVTSKNENTEFFLNESKIFSFSYPGTTTPVSNKKCLYLPGSQDDISHDSYELLENIEDNSQIYSRIVCSHTRTRSCSLDSGNYIPTDDESEHEKLHKFQTHYAFDKSRSTSDILDNDFFYYEDPRDLPKENLFIRSDGNFYKKVIVQMGSRTSSPESRSDVFDVQQCKSSDSSKKDSVYHTDSKKSRDTLKSKSESGSSSPDSKISFGETLLTKNYEMPATTGKLLEGLKSKLEESSRNYKQDDKNEFYDDVLRLDVIADPYDNEKNEYENCMYQKFQSHDNLSINKTGIEFKNNFYNTSGKHSSTFPSNSKTNKTTHVHSISLQNVEVERSPRNVSFKANESDHIVSRSPKSMDIIASNSIEAWPKEIETHSNYNVSTADITRQSRKRSNMENIFSFDKDKIDSLIVSPSSTTKSNETKNSPDYPLTPELLSEFDKHLRSSHHNLYDKKTKKEELMAKTHFDEYNPKMVIDTRSKIVGALGYNHNTVERTKSDPNSLANRPKLSANSRRHTLMHQKSIDLTPVESSEDEYLYTQIPSAPPVCRTHLNIFDMTVFPFEVVGIDQTLDLPKTGFEMPKSFFNDCEKNKLKNLNEDIPYILHKRHIMNGTAPTQVESKNRYIKPKSPKSPKSPKKTEAEYDFEADTSPGFLFTQNIDLSKINPVTLEVDKVTQELNIPCAKLDITKQMDLNALETLNNKLKQIESDSATSSKTDSLQHHTTKLVPKIVQLPFPIDNKKDFPPLKRLSKAQAKSQFHKQKSVVIIRKGKTRITSFSSDDESINSDDVFGSAEAVPTKMEFSPPQSRKDIEPILKHEQSKMCLATWARGQTMSSTEIEGSPPQLRRLDDFENRYHANLETLTNTELRRISEKSISIPSSEEENHIQFTWSNKHNSAHNIKKEPEDKNNTSESELTTKLKQNQNLLFKSNNKNIRKKLIEEIIDSSIIMRSRNQAPVLFAHARLNLSEGSAFASLQRQRAFESPTSDRRAKSLDTPVISLQNLPHTNAFSSKDDTVCFDEEADILEEKPIKSSQPDQKIAGKEKSITSCVDTYGLIYANNWVSDVHNIDPDPVSYKSTFDKEEQDLLERLKYIQKITLKGVKVKDKFKYQTKLKSGTQIILDIPKYKYKQFSSGNSSIRVSPVGSRSNSLESSKSKTKPIDVEKTDEFMQNKSPRFFNIDALNKEKNSPKKIKEKSKSVEKIDFMKKNPKKINQENYIEQAKRKERQQKLYETAMKQTVSVMSPVNDQLPTFPNIDDTICFKTQGNNIIIETDLKRISEDRVFIAKAPKKLECALAKVSRSFEDTNKSFEKLDKANRSFEDRDKLFDDKFEEEVPKSPKSLTKTEIKHKIEGVVVRKGKIDGKKVDSHKFLDIEFKSYLANPNTYNLSSPDEPLPPEPKINTDVKQIIKGASLDIWAHDRKHSSIERRTLSQPEAGEVEAIIFERRNLDLMKRQSFPVKNQENERNKLKTEDAKYTESNSFESKESDMDNILQFTDLPALPSTALQKNRSSNKNVRTEKSTSIEDESSVSLSVSRAFGISQDITSHDEQTFFKLRNSILPIMASETNDHKSRVKKALTLEKQYTLDFDSGSDKDNEFSRKNLVNSNNITSITPENIPVLFHIKTANHSLHKKTSAENEFKTKSIESKGLVVAESCSPTRNIQSKLHSRMRFQLESSTSSSLEDAWNPQETYEHYDYDNSEEENNAKKLLLCSEINFLNKDVSVDLEHSTQFFDTAIAAGFPLTSIDSLGTLTNPPLSRALSRISERSTNSEKSSIEEDKLSFQEEISHHDDSVISSERLESFSSDFHSISNPAYVSDAERRTSAEMPDIPCDSTNPEYKVNDHNRYILLMNETDVLVKHSRSNVEILPTNDSQDSEDWPLPDIPLDFDNNDHNAFLSNNSERKRNSKLLCWKTGSLIKSQDSDQWPSPPSTVLELTELANTETSFIHPEEQVQCNSKMFECMENFEEDKIFSDRDLTEVVHIVPDTSFIECNKERYPLNVTTTDRSSLVLSYEETYYMSDSKEKDNINCFSATLASSTCFKYEGKRDINEPVLSTLMRENDRIVIAQPRRSPASSPEVQTEHYSIDEPFLTDSLKEHDPDNCQKCHTRIYFKGSSTSASLVDEFAFKASSDNNINTYVSNDTSEMHIGPRRLSCSSCKRCSHSSHSEEETSSLGTDVDNTVKIGLQPKKCTHSSHSEDTSIGLSISEWSTGTNTVRQYGNLSGSDSLSFVSNYSYGLKSEKSNQTKSSRSSVIKSNESINDNCTIFTNNVKQDVFENDGLRYDMFSNSDTEKFSSGTRSDDTTFTFTEMAPSGTEWSTSSSHTLIGRADISLGLNSRVQKGNSCVDYIPLRSPKLKNKHVSLDYFSISNDCDAFTAKEKNAASDEKLLDKRILDADHRIEVSCNCSADDSNKACSSSNNDFSLNYHNYGDKTLSKYQIKQYKSTKLNHSQTVRERNFISPGISENEKTVLDTNLASENIIFLKHHTETNADKLQKFSSYCSSSLSSDSPPNQFSSPQSNAVPQMLVISDTDSSVDVRQQNSLKLKNRGIRKKKLIIGKKMKLKKGVDNCESSELSEEYVQKSERHENIHKTVKKSSTSKFEALDMSENVDEMGFPKYDRLGHHTTSMYLTNKGNRKMKRYHRKSSKCHSPESGSEYTSDINSSEENSKAGVFFSHESNTIAVSYPKYCNNTRKEKLKTSQLPFSKLEILPQSSESDFDDTEKTN